MIVASRGDDLRLKICLGPMLSNSEQKWLKSWLITHDHMKISQLQGVIKKIRIQNISYGTVDSCANLIL